MTSSADTGLGVTLVLGTEYEKKKQKLLEELQLDFRDHIAKETLREERKKEFNSFLQEKSQTTKLKNETSPDTPKSNAVKLTSHSTPSTFSDTPTNTMPLYNKHPSSRREVATLTEFAEKRQSRRNQSLPRRRYSPREFYSSEEITTDEEDDYHCRHRWRQDRSSQRPKYKEKRRYREHKTNRSFEDMLNISVNKESPVVENYSRSVLESGEQTPESIKSAGMTDFTTGLLIGAIEDQTVTHMKKEQYKKELLRQIAEEQKNKMKEKKLELRVAVTGATDPEKEPDRIKQFGFTYPPSRNSRQFQVDPDADVKNLKSTLEEEKLPEILEQRLPQRKFQIDYNHIANKPASQSGMLAGHAGSPFDYLREDYHRNPAALVGDMHVPRFAGVAPTLPPIIPNAYRSPYDAAYYYYGARNALDPSLQNHQTLPVGAPHFANFDISPQQPLPVRTNNHSEFLSDVTSKESLSAVESPHMHTPKFKSQLSYQEALKQQIKEKDIHKKREKEEQDDSKLMAQMKSYNPWGKSGGGAPIRDEDGNIVSDLNQLRRISNIMSTVDDCDDQFNSRRVLAQNRYKEELKKQMEENRRKQAEEQVRLRIEEEEEEKRLVKERERLRQEYEEELRKQKKMMTKTRSFKPGPERTKEVEETEQKNETSPQDARAASEKSPQMFNEKVPCPRVPTPQEKKTNFVTSRPCSSTSQFSFKTRSVSAPHGRLLPARLPPLTPLNTGQEEVIRELSALRKFLRREQRQLELHQAGLMDPGETRLTPVCSQLPKVERFGSARKEAVPPASRNHHLKDFNQQIYRGANNATTDEEWTDQQGSSELTKNHQNQMLRRRQMREEVNDSGDQRQFAPDVVESRNYNQRHSSKPDSVHGDHNSSAEKAIR